jgi:signal transduction histidine kinase
VNLPGVLMGVVAGIGIHATLTHGLVGWSRRPRDRARIAFAAAALSTAAGALALSAMYSATSYEQYVAVTKWVFFPASSCMTVATVWFVALYSDVKPLRFLYALSAGFAALVLLDVMLPSGLLHQKDGRLVSARVLGGTVMTSNGASPHALHYAADALTVAAFLFLCYAVYRVYRTPAAERARNLGLMILLLAVATLLDTINEHSVITTFTTLYLTQICFALVIVAVSMGLRRESLRTEAELQMYRTQMDALVEARVAELDEANERLALEAKERRATEAVLRQRVEELAALQRLAQILSGRAELGQTIDEVTRLITTLFGADYARVRLLADLERGHDDVIAARAAAERSATGAGETFHRLTELDLAFSDGAMRDGAIIAADAASWPGLDESLRLQVAVAGIGHVLAAPLTADWGPAGALVIARSAPAGPFSADDQRLANTVCEALTAVIEMDRLHRQETRRAAVEERQALARDLHDSVTQSLYSATLIAEALPAVWERDSEAGTLHLERLRRLVRGAMAEMRTLLFELRPAALAAAPLDALLERLGAALEGQVQAEVEVRLDEGIDLPDDVKIAFYRVTQEAFSNIAKHARAAKVTARVLAVDGGATLIVRDDGRVFDPAAVPSGHMGLYIMSERLERVSGTLTVDSAPGAGTTIRAAWMQSASDERPLEMMGV